MTGTGDEFPLSPSRAKTILRFLADGVDPDTGELLPADHILNRAEVVRALFFLPSIPLMSHLLQP